MPLNVADLELGRRLGRGAAGEIDEVVSVAGDPYSFPVVFKRYFTPSQVSGPGLERLNQFRKGLPERSRLLLDSRTAWPLVTVNGPDGNLVGYLMPRLPPAAFVEVDTATGRQVVPCEIQFLFNDDAALTRLLHATVPAGYRVALASDLAHLYGLLHQHGVVYGDLSWKNIVWTAFATAPRVILVDCDAVRMQGTQSAAPQMHSPGWIPPESSAGAAHQTSETDRYKLGLAMLRILSPGLHAQVHSCVPARDEPHLGAEGVALLQRALSTVPADRPTAEEWVVVLGRLAAAHPFAPMVHVTPPPPKVGPRPVTAARPAAAAAALVRARRPGTTTQAVPRYVPVGLRRPTWPPTATAFRPRPQRMRVPRWVLWIPWLAVVLLFALAALGKAGSVLAPATTAPVTAETVPSGPGTYRLLPGQQLQANDFLYAPPGYSLRLHSTGDLVLQSPTLVKTWHTGTEGRGRLAGVMQGDGNFVLRSADGQVVWSTQTFGHPGARLVLEATGNLVVRDDLGRVLWTSGTGG